MRLHLFGDSVLGGQVTDISNDPAPSLEPLRRPTAIMDLVAGREVAVFAGMTRIPKNAALGAEEMAAYFASGAVRTGDGVVLLDVGPHAMDTATHEADWLLFRRTATARHDVRLVMCSGFDNGALGRRDMQHEAPLDGRSPNDAVRAAASSPGEFRGQTLFLDIAAPLKRLHGQMQARWNLSPYFRDDVHLSGWGQIFLSLLLLNVFALPAPGLGRLARSAAANARRLGVRTELHGLETLHLIIREAGLPTLAIAPLFAAVRVRNALQPRRAAPAEPDSEAQGLADQGLAQMQAQDVEGALKLFRQAAALDGACMAALRGRAHAAALTGRHSEVIQAGRAALALAPYEAKYYVWVAEAALAAGPAAELVAWLDDLAEAHAPPRAFAAMAALTQAAGQPGRAEIWAERASFGA